MDVARTLFVPTIAALLAGTALAAPPSSSPADFAGQSDWSNAGPTTIPTISASPNSRYANPQNAQPVGGQQFSPAATSTSQQPQSWSNGAPQQSRSAAKSARSATQQTLGAPSYSSPSSNSFATPATAPATGSTALGGSAPPPWPTNSTAPTTTAAPSWSDSLTPAAPVDHSVLTTPTTIQPSNGWSAIGTSIAAPPLLVPQLPASNTSFAPISTTPIDSGPTLTTDSYRGQQSTQSPSGYSSQQPTTTAPVRTASAGDDWATSWDGNPSNNSAAPVGRNANSSPRSGPNRDSSFGPSQPVATNPQETGRMTGGQPTDSWNDNSWSRNSQSPPGGPSASISASKPAVFGPANNSGPGIQQPANSSPYGPSTAGSNANNFPSVGANPNGQQPPMVNTSTRPIQAGTSATGEPQPWVTFVLVMLSLVGSLAGNLYLGWSYLDARQKYQALVRRTADTFRRTKQPVAA